MKNKPLVVILTTVILDAVGIGLVMPIIPQLFREAGHLTELGWQYGAFLSLYALMQFVFSPVLGALSDRFGRRPVLLVSLAGAAVDYLAMAVAPSLWLLYVGRAIAGITGASMAVATAYLSDITPPDQRARRFGQLSACFGIGFIVGPVLGGVLGTTWVRAPFCVAALFNALNFLVAMLALPESPAPRTVKFPLKALNPLSSLRWVFSFRSLLPLMLTFVVIILVGQVGGTIWVLYGQEKFAWDTLTVGLSLAGFGVFHALAQGLVAGPVVDRWGERAALMIGIVADSAAYVLLALATHGWMAFCLYPLFCLGGIGEPALKSLMTARVSNENQGQLQGVLASLMSLASIFGPLGASAVYGASRGFFPGLVWVLGATLYLLCVPVVFRKGGPLDRGAKQGKE